MGTRLTFTVSTRRLIDERDSTNSHFEDSELYDYHNQAIRLLGAELEWPLQTAEASSIANQAVYTLPDDFISLVDAYFDNTKLGILERADLPAIDATWQDSVASTPIYAYKSDNAKMGLYFKPDTSGLTIQIQYIKLPADLSSDIDVPDLHTAFQDCIPFYSAFLCEHSMGNDKRAQVNFGLYDTHKKKLQSKLQRFSDETMRFRWADRRMY
jgi:hypothetical protein